MLQLRPSFMGRTEILSSHYNQAGICCSTLPLLSIKKVIFPSIIHQIIFFDRLFLFPKLLLHEHLIVIYLDTLSYLNRYTPSLYFSFWVCSAQSDRKRRPRPFVAYIRKLSTILFFQESPEYLLLFFYSCQKFDDRFRVL